MIAPSWERSWTGRWTRTLVAWTPAMCDGCGLNSPGQWRPGARGLGLSSDARDLTQRLRSLLQSFVWERIPDVKKEFFRLSMGKMLEAPFSEIHMDRLRREWFALLPDLEAAKVVAGGQPFYLEALCQTSRLLGDEDWEILTRGVGNYARGCMVGVDAPFPRVPFPLVALVSMTTRSTRP